VTFYEDLTIALDVVLAAATTVALYYGLLGMVRQSVRGDRLGSVGRGRGDVPAASTANDEEPSPALHHSPSI
jgi:hypothetical protein